MNDVKLLNRILWGVNTLLGAGIVVFSFQYLLRAADSKIDIKPDDDGPHVVTKARDEGDGTLKSLQNPVEPPRRGGGRR